MIDTVKPVFRDAVPADLAALLAVHRAAFAGEQEARLVQALNDNCDSLISVVAELDANIAGHILFSPVTTEPASQVLIYGLAPMAVLPPLQRHGIGSRLVETGLMRCRDCGVGAVVVLGHKEYYPRFGFQPAASLGLGCVYDVPQEVFMALELERGALRNVSGTVHYHSLFDEL